MKKIFSFISLILIIIIAIFATFFAQNTNNDSNKKDIIYIHDNTLATMLNYSSNNIVQFKSTYPRGVDIHEYEFTSKEVNDFEKSKGVYYLENTAHNNLKNIANKHALNNDLKPNLTTLDDHNIDIHFSIDVKTMKNIYLQLTKKFKKYQNSNRVNTLLNKFDTTIQKVNKIRQQNHTIVSIHQAWNYINMHLNNKISMIGNFEGELLDNKQTSIILSKLQPNDFLLSEVGEQLTPTEQKLITKYKLKNIKVHTFETHLKDINEYFNKIISNQKELSK